MDTTITGRAFRVSEPSAGRKDFHEILLGYSAKPSPKSRELDIGDEVVLRLEYAKLEGEWLNGEFVRVQTKQIPPQAGPDGLEPIVLKDGRGLGHLATFAYNMKTRVIVLQTNRLSATPSRIYLYTAGNDPQDLFVLKPVLSQDAMARFTKKKPRGFSVTFAGPKNLDFLSDQNLAIAEAAKLIAEAYGGIRVRIDVSVGKSRKKILDKDSILTALGDITGLPGVKRLKVQAEESGMDDDFINFLKEQIHGSRKIDLHESDHEVNRTQKLDFLKSIYNTHSVTIQKQFG